MGLPAHVSNLPKRGAAALLGWNFYSSKHHSLPFSSLSPIQPTQLAGSLAWQSKAKELAPYF